ncbi:helix-turn-helix transcriptional regulator [Clostridium faecium]
MYISYNKLWKLLIDKNMNKQELKKISGVSSASIAKLGKGANITTDVLLRICEALDCDIADIMEIVKDGRTKSNVKE